VFVALGIQHAMRVRHIVIVACPALQNFSTFLFFINGMIFENKLLNTKRVFRFSLQLLPGTFLVKKEMSEI
jgi:hypothetical protein